MSSGCRRVSQSARVPATRRAAALVKPLSISASTDTPFAMASAGRRPRTSASARVAGPSGSAVSAATHASRSADSRATWSGWSTASALRPSTHFS